MFSTAVMSHPARQRNALELVRKVDGARLVVDPQPSGASSALRTATLAWAAIEPGASHHVVLQDDAILSEHWSRGVTDAVRELPKVAIAFYVNWHIRDGAAVRLAMMSGHRWVRGGMDDYASTVCMLLPSDLARDFARLAGGLPGESRGDDVVMDDFLRTRRIDLYLAAPSLVEHEGDLSIVGNSAHGVRRAACFDPWGTAFAGNQGVLEPAVVPYFRHARAYVLFRSDRDETGWDKATWQESFALVTPEHRIADTCASFYRILDDNILMNEHLDSKMLRELWMAGFLLGAFGRLYAGPERARHRAAPLTAVRQGAATLGTGGLLHRYEFERLTRARPVLELCARHGIRAGWQSGLEMAVGIHTRFAAAQ